LARGGLAEKRGISRLGQTRETEEAAFDYFPVSIILHLQPMYDRDLMPQPPVEGKSGNPCQPTTNTPQTALPIHATAVSWFLATVFGILGKPVLLDESNEDGRAVLAFTDSKGVLHSIFRKSQLYLGAQIVTYAWTSRGRT
jgi:hypothetical protein